MFIKFLRLVNTIYTSNTDNDSMKNTDLVDYNVLLIHQYLSEIETILIEVKKFREKEIEIFTKNFRNIVKSYTFKEVDDVLWPLRNSPALVDYLDIPTTGLNLKNIVRKYIVNKLFFNDLLFCYYDFCYKMKDKFFKEIFICESKLLKIVKLVMAVRGKRKIPNNVINLDTFNDFTSDKFNIYNFFNESESIVRGILGLSQYKIENMFQTDLWFWFGIDIKDGCNIYKFIHHCMKKYNTFMSEDERSCWQFHNVRSISEGSPIRDFEWRYLNWLTLDITGEYKKTPRSSEDTRFTTYKKSMHIINSCKTCSEYCKDMLKNVRCDKHRKTLDRIRAEYFEFMDGSWFFCSIFSNVWPLYPVIHLVCDEMK